MVYRRARKRCWVYCGDPAYHCSKSLT
jgi:hypothetical protein